MSDDFEIPYTSSEFERRSLVDGKYAIEVSDVKLGLARAGKMEGKKQLEWICFVVGGPLSKMQLRFTTMLEPVGEGGMSWTTDRIIKAIFPAIQAGNMPKKSDLLGKRLEVLFEVNKNKDGTASIYGKIREAYPYVEGGFAGAVDQFEPSGHTGQDDVGF